MQRWAPEVKKKLVFQLARAGHLKLLKFHDKMTESFRLLCIAVGLNKEIVVLYL
jgi:hypothetical protein